MKQQKMLNVGCGDYFDPRWTNIDIYSSSPSVIEHDITKGLPFESETFDVVYHSHILEHLDRASGASLMRECYRVLKPNGLLRVVVPDLEFSCRFYLQNLEQVLKDETPLSQEHYEWGMLNLFDQMVRSRSGGEIMNLMARENLLDIEFIVENAGGTVIKELRDLPSESIKSSRPSQTDSLLQRMRKLGGFRQLIKKRLLQLSFGEAARQISFRQTGEVHQWMYDRYSLGSLFNMVGFKNVKFLTASESGIADWSSYALDVKADGSVHKPNSLFGEATK